MPTVDGKEFPYDAAGMARARAASKKSGQPMRTGQQPGGQPGGKPIGRPGKEGTSYKGGVRPINPNADVDPNAGAVNNFMNREALKRNSGPMAGAGDVAKMQRGLNTLNRGQNGYTPLKPDGIYGPKTAATARQYFGGNQSRGNNRGPRRV